MQLYEQDTRSNPPPINLQTLTVNTMLSVEAWKAVEELILWFDFASSVGDGVAWKKHNHSTTTGQPPLPLTWSFAISNEEWNNQMKQNLLGRHLGK